MCDSCECLSCAHGVCSAGGNKPEHCICEPLDEELEYYEGQSEDDEEFDPYYDEDDEEEDEEEEDEEDDDEEDDYDEGDDEDW